MRIVAKGKTSAALLVLALLGCKDVRPTSAAAGSGEGTAASGASAAATTAGVATKVAYISDSTLNNMNAFSVKIPSRWQFQGTLFQGGTCVSIPMAVYRAASPDGQTKAEQEPGMSWQWGTGPKIGFMPKNDCLPIKGPISAQDFLKYFAGTLKVNYVGSEDVPSQVNSKAQQALQDAQASVAGKYAAKNMQPPKSTRELARAIVIYQNGQVAMKGRLHVQLDCMENHFAGQPGLSAYGGPGHPPQMIQGPPSTVSKCTANVVFVTAPDSKFKEVEQAWDASGMGATAEDAWQQAWIQRNQQETQQWIDNMWRTSRTIMQQRQDQFNHDQAVRQHMHEDFLAAMQRGTDISIERTRDAMDARSTSTSDWVDYALDRQTVMDTRNGMTYKIPNQVTVQQPLQQVHGDGTPW